MSATNNPIITELERSDFIKALARYCGCNTDELGDIVGAPCRGHREANDPNDGWLKRLAFIRREIVIQLQTEEMTHGKPVPTRHS